MKCQVNVAILYTYSRSLNVSTLFYSLFHLPNVVDIYSYSSLDVLNVLKTFPAVFLAHPIAQVFRSLKTQGLRVRITLVA